MRLLTCLAVFYEPMSCHHMALSIVGDVTIGVKRPIKSHNWWRFAPFQPSDRTSTSFKKKVRFVIFPGDVTRNPAGRRCDVLECGLAHCPGFQRPFVDRNGPTGALPESAQFSRAVIDASSPPRTAFVS
ncbi:hypothetical protein Zmor_023463 [Zophobas morio]|uniref:Uncharacterized protein n=1 Tax=Zophobas morio TaxID=2755281 RepID=A0AA38HZV2_9CUCU|nr:hypothetical protein Zmor_023463 [Zophobas morio]